MTLRSLAIVLLALLSAAAVHAQSTDAPAKGYRVLLVGNSLTYTNNLPALLRAVGAAQGTPIVTETWVAPGGTLNERREQGHVSASLRANAFDAVVLQEQGGHLAACMASLQEQRKAPCAASLRAYSEFAELAREKGAKVLLFASWGPDERWDGRLGRSTQMIAEKTTADVFDAAAALQALRKAQPGASVSPDGTHPSTQASLMLALALYRDISGQAPEARELRVAAPLLPVNAAVTADRPMEAQPGIAGDGKVTVVPASLIEPLVKALPDPAAARPDPRRRRGR